jgi:PTH1 family peptidyl-tRNA hydrolase
VAASASGWLVAGLGNPGPEYADSRHNAGFMVADVLASRWGSGPSAFRTKFHSELLQLDWRGERIYLQKPLQYMNLSGGPVQGAMTFFRVAPPNLIVIHDEIDLPFLRLRVKQGGGHGGHNGLRSISQAIGPDYLRVRVGVGRPGGTSSEGGSGKERVTGHVLGPFSRADKLELPAYLDRVADAVEAILLQGLAFAMNNFNKDLQPSPRKE